MTHLGTAAITPKKFTMIEGGRDEIERNLLIGLFEGDTAEVEKLSVQLNAIAKKYPTRLRVLSNQQIISIQLNQD